MFNLDAFPLLDKAKSRIHIVDVTMLLTKNILETLAYGNTWGRK